MLADRNVSTSGAIVLFGIYLAVFLLDELALFGAAVVTLRATKLQEKHGQALHLVSGALMTTLAVTMLVAPERLESIFGTLSVFAIAVLVAGVLWFLKQGSRKTQARIDDEPILGTFDPR